MIYAVWDCDRWGQALLIENGEKYAVISEC